MVFMNVLHVPSDSKPLEKKQSGLEIWNATQGKHVFFFCHWIH